MKKQLIAATGLSLAILLTTDFADESEFTNAVFANSEVTSTQEYKRIYEKESSQCNQEKNNLATQRCEFEAKQTTLRKLGRL
jgi:hypothetical protein